MFIEYKDEHFRDSIYNFKRVKPTAIRAKIHRGSDVESDYSPVQSESGKMDRNYTSESLKDLKGKYQKTLIYQGNQLTFKGLNDAKQ